jgi:rRNA maturation RNase YbeY
MIEINNLTNFAVDKKVFSTVAKKVLLGENRGTETLSLAFIGKREMQKINKKYRGKNKPTDVLSFGNVPCSMFHVPSEGLGEIIICPEVVKEKKEEMLEVFVHGILHLCEYDHEKSKKQAEEMEAREKTYLAK